MSFRKFALTAFGLLLLVSNAMSQNILEDDGVGMSLQELEVLVQYWTPNMQQAAANDPGDRFELLSMALANKKMAAQAKSATPEFDPERYWKLQFVLRNIETKFVLDNYMADLEIPDMSALAEETYVAAKDKYAMIPEERMTSHILLKCTPPDCNVEEKRAEAQGVLAQLEAGAEFEALVAQYSEDPGSKDKDGVFDRWLVKGMPRVEPHYLLGAFSIEGVGNHTGIVESQFGFHIIRLDDIKEQGYKPYDEVREVIIASLQQEYKKLAAKEFDSRYRLTDKAFIDGAAMDKVFAPFKEHAAPAK